MRSIDTFPDILIHRLPVDGRKQIHGLCQVVKSSMGKDLFSDALFVFINRGFDVLRLLYWDKTGFAMWIKRLEKDKFRWPHSVGQEVLPISSKELSWLLDGIDILRTRPHQILNFSEI